MYRLFSLYAAGVSAYFGKADQDRLYEIVRRPFANSMAAACRRPPVILTAGA